MKGTDRQGPELVNAAECGVSLRLFATLGFAAMIDWRRQHRRRRALSFSNNFHTISIYWTHAKNAKPPVFRYRRTGTRPVEEGPSSWWDEKSSRVSQANFQNNQ